MKERRRYVRSNGLVLVNYRIPQLNLQGKSSAFDISGAGVRITLEKKLEQASAVEMEIYLPGNSQPIMAKGEVIWSQEIQDKLEHNVTPKKTYFFTGIKFTVISESNKARILNYIREKFYHLK